MNQLKKTDVFIEVEKVTEYKVTRKVGNVLMQPQWSFVEKLPNQYCFTEPELVKLIGNTWIAAMEFVYDYSNTNTSTFTKPSVETFINNLFKPTTNE